MLVEGDPGFLEHKEHYFMHIAKAISKGSTHPLAPGGCVIGFLTEALNLVYDPVDIYQPYFRD